MQPRNQCVQSQREVTAKLLHAPRKVAPHAMDQQVIVVGHQRVGVNLEGEPLHRLAEAIKEENAIRLITKDQLPARPQVHDVVPCSREVYAALSNHAGKPSRALVQAQVLSVKS